MSELQFLERFSHPFIIKYFEDFPLPNDFTERHCIVLEYADGLDLRKKMIMLNFKISEDQALNWFTQVCLALA